MGRHRHFHGFIIALLLLLSVAASLRFLWTSGLPMHGDLNFPLSLERYVNHFCPLWSQYGSVSNFESIDRLLFMGPLLAVGSVLGISMEWFAKLLIVGILFVSGLSMYLAAFWILGRVMRREGAEGHRAVAAMLSAVVYMFSPWVMYRISAYLYWWSYALTPLILVSFMYAVTQRKPAVLVLTAFLYALASTSPQYTVFIGVLLFGWFLYSWALTKEIEFVPSLKLAGVFAVVYVLFSMYWILPALAAMVETTITPGYVTRWEDTIAFSANSQIVNVIRGMDEWLKWWATSITDDASHPLHGLWIMATFAFPILCFMALLLKRSAYAIFFGMVAVVAIVLGAGSQGPCPGVSKWLMFDAPVLREFGWIIRAPEKFGAFLWLAYAFLIGMLVLAILEKRWFLRTAWDKFLKIASVALILAVFGFAAGPKFAEGLWHYYVPVQIPEEYYEVNRWLTGQPDEFKVLWLGPYEFGDRSFAGDRIYTWATDRMAANVVPHSSSKPSLGFYHYTTQFAQYHAFVYTDFKTEYFDKYIDFLNVKYVVYQDDLVGAEERVASDLEYLMAQEGLEFVRHIGFLYVFENTGYAPLLSVPSTTYVAVGGLDGLVSLNSFDSFSPGDTAVTFVENELSEDMQNLVLGIPSQDGVVFYNDSLESLVPVLVERDSMVLPFDHTSESDPCSGWARALTAFRFEGQSLWHEILKSLEVNDRWEFDYSRGIVVSSAEASELRIGVDVDREGSYELYLRCFASGAGGKIGVGLGADQVVSIDTNSQVDSFVWRKAGDFELSAGDHTLTLVNEEGSNAVNLFILLPEGVYEGVLKRCEELVDQTRNIYIWDFNDLAMAEGDREWIVQVAKTSRYGIALRADDWSDPLWVEIGSSRQSIDLQEDIRDGQWVHGSVAVELDKGEHSVAVPPGVSAVMLYSVDENENPNNIFESGEAAYPLDVTAHDATRYVVRIEDVEGPFVLSLAETYDSLWTAKVNGKEYGSLPAYSVGNEFWIEESGDLEITVEYKLQRWFYWGAALSAGALLVVLSYVVWMWVRGRRMKTPL